MTPDWLPVWILIGAVVLKILVDLWDTYRAEQDRRRVQRVLRILEIFAETWGEEPELVKRQLQEVMRTKRADYQL